MKWFPLVMVIYSTYICDRYKVGNIVPNFEPDYMTSGVGYCTIRLQ